MASRGKERDRYILKIMILKSLQSKRIQAKKASSNSYASFRPIKTT